MKFKKLEKEGLFRSLFIAYAILLLHVVLLAGTGVTVVLFRGVYLYLPWIMGLLGILVLVIAWAFYRQMRNSSSDIKGILSLPEFQNRTVEIKLLGGLASFKIKANPKPAIGHHPSSQQGNRRRLEEKINQTEQKILELTALFEKDIISKEEFEKTKQDILQG